MNLLSGLKGIIMENMIDRTSFNTVKRYFDDPNSSIKTILLVPKEYKLSEVAEQICNCQSEEAFSSLLEDGLFKLVTDDTSIIVRLLSKSFPMSEISEDEDVFVIYLESIYLIQRIL